MNNFVKANIIMGVVVLLWGIPEFALINVIAALYCWTDS